MRPSLATMAPLLLTLSAAGWLIWNLMGGPAPEAARVKLARIDASLLAPRLGAPPARDPFVGPGAAAQGRAATSPPKPTATGIAPKASPASGPGLARGLAQKVAVSLSDLGRWWENTRGEIEARKRLARAVQAEVAGQARLSATSIRGARRMAILNDRAYVEGEVIAGLGSLRGPVVVSQIRPSSVVLRYRGASAVVSFPSIARGSSGVGGPTAPASRPTGRPPRGGRP
jgi:hypothetical protein